MAYTLKLSLVQVFGPLRVPSAVLFPTLEKSSLRPKVGDDYKPRRIEDGRGVSSIVLRIIPYLIAPFSGKKIVLSNGALRPSEVRGPFDLMNLGVLFGMNQSQAKDAVSK